MTHLGRQVTGSFFIVLGDSCLSRRPSAYAQRHLVECCFSKLKQFRRVATRFEKTARNYLAVVTLAAIVLWLR
jgi:transposase